MRRLFEISMFAVFASPIFSAQTGHSRNPLGHGPDVVAAGHALFNRTCTSCHGVDGTEGERAPALVGDRRFFRLSEGALFDTIKEGLPGTAMPALGLPDDDIWRIVVFIRAMRGAASDSDVIGDPNRGRLVFEAKGECQKCHAIDGNGGTIGPDLSNIGAQVTLQQLRNSLTVDGPIPEGYRPVKVTTSNGEIVEGIAKNEDGFSVQVLDYNNKLHLYDKSELREIVHGQKSLMPHNYDKVLTADELQDLIAMLSRQAETKVHIGQPGEGEAGR
jgi:cytochrome c oxidase cbb3-type subunit 3